MSFFLDGKMVGKGSGKFSIGVNDTLWYGHLLTTGIDWDPLLGSLGGAPRDHEDEIVWCKSPPFNRL